MTGRYPRPGWNHRRTLILRDALVAIACGVVVVLTGLGFYQAVVGLLVALLIVSIAVVYASRPSPAQVDAWRRHHGNRWGDRW